MGKVFVISDLHLSHKNMAIKRGFKDETEHDNFIIEQWNKVVLGNHDQPQHVKELLKYVNSVCGMIKYKGFILSHCPVHESELERYYKNIHGHVHENSLADDRYINVSCEVVNYSPVPFPYYFA